MFFRCHCIGPWSNWNLALLAHIYAKVAICKSCERVRHPHSRKRLSPGKPRFRPSAARALRRGMATVPALSPGEIWTSVRAVRPSLVSPRSPIKYPRPRRRATAPPGIRARARSRGHLSRGALPPPRAAASRPESAWDRAPSSQRCLQALRAAAGPLSGHLSASHPRACRFDISAAPDHGCDSSSRRSRQSGRARVGMVARKADTHTLTQQS